MENVSKTYKKRGRSYNWKRRLREALRLEKIEYTRVLSNISFNINDGEIFGILGPNGAGKTTMLKIMAGLLLPEEGEVTVNGYNIVKDKPQVRTSVNFLMSSGWIIFDYKYTVYDNLKFWGVVQGLRRDEVKKRVPKVLEIVGLVNKKNEFTENLSAGMRQRMNIARCLLVDKPIYLMDEPTTHVDSCSADYIRQFIMHTLKKRGYTIVVATNNLWEAEALCDRVAILDRGKVILVDNPQSIKKRIGVDRLVVEVNANIERLSLKLQSFDFVNRIKRSSNTLQIYGRIKEHISEVIEAGIECKSKVKIRDIKEQSLNEIFIELMEGRTKYGEI